MKNKVKKKKKKKKTSAEFYIQNKKAFSCHSVDTGCCNGLPYISALNMSD